LGAAFVVRTRLKSEVLSWLLNPGSKSTLQKLLKELLKELRLL
jgi:hypothetical protein